MGLPTILIPTHMAENTLINKILKGVNDLTHLEIKTIVGAYTIHEDGTNTKVEPQSNQDMIYSKINLVGGDITTAMGDKFLTDAAYSPLRDYHDKREQQGHDIVERNIEVLKQLVSFISSLPGQGEDSGEGDDSTEGGEQPNG